jgi:hypothetical protein
MSNLLYILTKIKIFASSGAKMIKIRLEMTSNNVFEKCGFI